MENFTGRIYILLGRDHFEKKIVALTNLGALRWYSDAEKEVEQIKQVKTPEQLHGELKKKFPKSAWHQREWVSVEF